VRAAASSHLAALPLFFRANAVEKRRGEQGAGNTGNGKAFFSLCFVLKLRKLLPKWFLFLTIPPM
jgi:hypothetical protein